MAEKKKKASNSSMRLDKFLVEMGKGSRSQIKEMAKKGRIQVNGTVIKATDGKIDPEKDVVLLDGQPVSYAHTEYFMLNKPAGTVSATEDGKYPTVISLIDAALRKDLFPVGRLDLDSEGLLLLTNDGDLLNALTHPRHEVEKHYEVRVRGNLENIPKLAEPMEIDGYSIRPATVVTIDRDEISAKLRLTIHEGRNRQIRKMCEKCGLEVRRLKRVAMGTMPLDPHLKSGAWRELTDEEIGYLQDIAADVQDGAIPHN